MCWPVAVVVAVLCGPVRRVPPRRYIDSTEPRAPAATALLQLLRRRGATLMTAWLAPCRRPMAALR
jgi:hypothetical protein